MICVTRSGASRSAAGSSGRRWPRRSPSATASWSRTARLPSEVRGGGDGGGGGGSSSSSSPGQCARASGRERDRFPCASCAASSEFACEVGWPVLRRDERRRSLRMPREGTVNGSASLQDMVFDHQDTSLWRRCGPVRHAASLPSIPGGDRAAPARAPAGVLVIEYHREYYSINTV